MNGAIELPAEWSDADPTVDYYDSDHPASGEPGADDAWSRMTGWGQDEAVYASYATRGGGDVLELCAGSGRITAVLAKHAAHVTAVDASAPMLAALRARIAGTANVTVEAQDVTQLALPRRDYPLAVMAYNSFPLLRSEDAQMNALAAARAHLAPGGMLVLDCDNAHHIPPIGRPPSFAFTRRHRVRGNIYSKWIGVAPMAADQTVVVHGWYDEVANDGTVRRRFWSSDQRAVHPSELLLMCRLAGFREAALRSTWPGMPFSAQASRFVLEAVA